MLLRMPEIHRAPLFWYMDGFSTKEIARLLDAPLGTILPVSTGAEPLRANDVDLRRGDAPSRWETTMGETTAAILCSEAVRQLWDYLDHAIAP